MIAIGKLQLLVFAESIMTLRESSSLGTGITTLESVLSRAAQAGIQLEDIARLIILSGGPGTASLAQLRAVPRRLLLEGGAPLITLGGANMVTR